MSHLSMQAAVGMHNDDHDEVTNPINNKLSNINSRITSPLIIKRQQNSETEIANNQAYDEIHDLQPKQSLTKKTTTSNQPLPSKVNQSHQLMQGNYYDPTRYDIDYASSSVFNRRSEPGPININLEEYKKTISPVSTSHKARSNSPPFGDTSESIKQGVAQSAGILLEVNKQQSQPSSMKTNKKSHERAAISCFPDETNKTRSASPSSSECSSSDSSTSNKSPRENEKTTIPYEKLLNDEDEDEVDQVNELTKKPSTESSTLLTKNLPQTYGTQLTGNSPCERAKCLPTNGYNSYGSSITTKSSSDNSGSVRTNSGSDNDEESDEEHYNNSTQPKNSPSAATAMKSSNISTDHPHSYSKNGPNRYQTGRSDPTRSEQSANNDEHHLQLPRFKQLSNDDPNGNIKKSNLTNDQNSPPYIWKESSQTSSSSQQNLNPAESQEQQQSQHSSSTRNNSHSNQTKPTKKRKPSQQQEVIRTESIPGHRGGLDVDELVMFIDGNSSRRQQRQPDAPPLRSSDANKPSLSSKGNALAVDANPPKTSAKKKARKTVKTLSSSNDSVPVEQDVQPITFTDQVDQATHSIVNITNPPSEERDTSAKNESHSNIDDVNSKSITQKTKTPLSNWFEQTQETTLPIEDIDPHLAAPTSATNLSNGEIISEPFVTVTHRRRVVKDRRPDYQNNTVSRSSHFPPPPPPPSSSGHIHDKRRISSKLANGTVPPVTGSNLPTNRLVNHSIIKEENTPSISSEPLSLSSMVKPPNESSTEKQESSPRLSSHSSSSSLSSLLRRQSKAPPVVFLNKSADIELTDVSFGFDLDSDILNQPSDPTNEKSSTHELHIASSNSSTPPSSEPIQSNEMLTDSVAPKSPRKGTQRNNRTPQFYSGSDIRPQYQRNYAAQGVGQVPYIDPLLLLQYNQQRLVNYSQQIAYMNYLRTQQYAPPPSQYVFLPTTYAASATENDSDSETNAKASDRIQEPLVVYTSPTGQLYYHQPMNKKLTVDSEQQQPTSYPPPTVYPSNYFYPTPAQNLIPSPTAYFQPIPSLVNNSKSEQNHRDNEDEGDHENPSKLYPPMRQPSSSDIMSNALQLVYSQQKRNAQTDRFNLDDLTAYLAMKWTDTVDHYEQGDSRILLVDYHQ